MNEKDKHTIESIIYYCDRMEDHTKYFGDNIEEYRTNNHFQDACSLVIIQIGEFVGRLSDEFRQKHEDIPWNEIIGMRIVHAHNYESVIDEIVWETIKEDIPQLKKYLQKLL